MGKKLQRPASASPASETSPPPRMDAPPPYDQVFSARRSSDISIHSNDRMNPNARSSSETADNSTHRPSPARQVHRDAGPHRDDRAKRHREADGGCLNFGHNVKGAMNIGGGRGSGPTNGCMVGLSQTTRQCQTDFTNGLTEHWRWHAVRSDRWMYELPFAWYGCSQLRVMIVNGTECISTTADHPLLKRAV